MALIDEIKLAKRINHNGIDSDIRRLIGVARAEMIRVGIDEDMANGEDDLIKEAIITRTLGALAETPELRAEFKEAYRIQIDELRKSEGYRRCTTTSSNSEE